MRNVRKIAGVAMATCGILFATVGVAGASNGKGTEANNIPVLSNIDEFDWENSPFCGFQIKTKETAQETSCPVVTLENSPNSVVVLFPN
ncbi:hypothetical protein OG946_02815 [Streptomyces sp. NBC_01808]|uniref:hypothetical protein n=1 Tax=Streptomyces sp. NBC_01808 TaxID=2975947 RepID=UPI002DDA68DB|nr:hypothetical protein [Streptomyces sp. NBC_01808]WSA36400.1 hypothetical protein OG946_02815 [Streptomyces sp. NBC_01808]